MDDADRAYVVDEYLLGAEIERARRASMGRPAPSSGPRLCLECGEPIPEARLKAVPGAILCTACQAEEEARWR